MEETEKKEPIVSYMTSGGIHGKGDFASFDLYEDGTIERWGKKIGTLGEDEVKGLIGMFEEHDFFSMDDSYTERRGFDFINYEITYAHGDRNKTVSVTDGSDAPEGFWEIRKKLYEIGMRKKR